MIFGSEYGRAWHRRRFDSEEHIGDQQSGEEEGSGERLGRWPAEFDFSTSVRFLFPLLDLDSFLVDSVFQLISLSISLWLMFIDEVRRLVLFVLDDVDFFFS